MALPLSVSPNFADQDALLTHAGTISSIDGSVCVLDVSGETYSAHIATHILMLVPGQRVVIMGSHSCGWLITAAWPMEGADAAYRFDASTGTLHIQAPRLMLDAISGIELRCGNAQVKLSLDGKIHIEGNEVLSSAIGSNRIEGASIDLN